MTRQSVKPYNDKVFKTFPRLNRAQRDRVISTAETTFQGWKPLGVHSKAPA